MLSQRGAGATAAMATACAGPVIASTRGSMAIAVEESSASSPMATVRVDAPAISAARQNALRRFDQHDHAQTLPSHSYLQFLAAHVVLDPNQLLGRFDLRHDDAIGATGDCGSHIARQQGAS